MALLAFQLQGDMRDAVIIGQHNDHAVDKCVCVDTVPHQMHRQRRAGGR